MKKYVLMALVALSLLTVSCTPRDYEAPSEVDSDTLPISPSEVSTDLAVVSNLSSNYEAPDSIGTEDGHYDMFEQNIYYTDYATASRVPLCSAPNCEHNDASCTSFFNGDGILFLDKAQEHLFYLGSNSDISEVQSDEEFAYRSRDILYRMELSGSGRELIYDFGVDKRYNRGTIVATDDRLYLIYATNEDGEHKLYLGELDTVTGNLTAIKEVEPNEYIVSAFGSTIVTDNNGSIIKYDLLSGEAAVAYEYSYENEKITFFADTLYIYDITVGEVSAISLVTNEENLITELANNEQSVQIRLIHNNFLEVNIYREEQHEKQVIDISTGQVYNPLLTMKRDWSIDAEPLMPVLDANSGQVLVAVRSEEREVTAYDPGGVPYTMLTPVDVTALISWEDYLHSNPDYTYIVDLTV